MTLHGLDRAQAPPAAKAKQMLDAVHGKWWNVYVGGPTSLASGWSPTLVKSYVAHGIERFMLTYAGRQQGGPLTRTQAQADAREALRLAKSYGYTGHFPLCLDVELPTFESAPSRTIDYTRAWCESVHAAGARPGVYANPGPLKAMAEAGIPARFVWIASWVSHSTGRHDPHAATSMPAHLWAKKGERAWQYAATFAGGSCRVLGLEVDVNVADDDVLAHAPGQQQHDGTPAADAPPFPGRILERGVFGDDVGLWQGHMKERGWHLQPTGKFDANSETICRQFQAEKDLAVTGQVNRGTWDATWSAPITP
jgi:hypothetical protein